MNTEQTEREEKEFIHRSKGPIWGYLKDDENGWLEIELTRQLKGSNRIYQNGETIFVRKSLINNLED